MLAAVTASSRLATQMHHKHRLRRGFEAGRRRRQSWAMPIFPMQYLGTRRTPVLCMAVTLMAPLAANADIAGLSDDGLRVSGYGTLGVSSVHGADPWRFRREIIQPASSGQSSAADIDTRIGLQADWRASQQWELVGQILLKRRAAAAPASESLAWAFASYTPNPQWTVHIGRTSPDLFLLADYRNVGFAFPWVRPSVEFYGWRPISAIDGVDVIRAWEQGDAHWRAKAFAGRSRLTLAGADGDTPVDGKRMAGFTLSREEQGLTFKVSLARAVSQPSDTGPLESFRNALLAVTRLPVPSVAAEASALIASVPGRDFVTRYGALGASWDLGAWQLQAEAAKISGNFSASRASCGYASVAYRLRNATLYTMLGAVRPTDAAMPVPAWAESLTPVVGPAVAALVQQLGAQAAAQNNLSRQDQQTVTFGTRVDLGASTALKLQWDAIRVRSNGSGLWYGASAEARKVNVYSAVLDVVF